MIQHTDSPALLRLLTTVVTADSAAALTHMVETPAALLARRDVMASRAVIAQALNLLLLWDFLARVPSARRYVQKRCATGGKVVLDHVALHTVALEGMGTLPAGHAAIARLLEPLGYRAAGEYPLPALNVVGRAFTHEELPEGLPQFFVSELNPQRFSTRFQVVVHRITRTSRDPLNAIHVALLRELQAEAQLPLPKARQLIPALLFAFGRHHDTPRFRDYQCLLAESSEMAWIATEGNALHRATHRVADLDAHVREQRLGGMPLEDRVEVSASGRVRRTAFRHEVKSREFGDSLGGTLTRRVPSSVYELIERGPAQDEATAAMCLDLGFDTRNAHVVFGMTGDGAR